MSHDHITIDPNCNPIGPCSEPDACDESFSTDCIISNAEDKLCGTDIVYAQGDSQTVINDKIVDYFCANGAGVPIPIPQISVIGEKIYLHFLPTEDMSFLAQNPRIFLFHKKKKKNKRVFNSVGVRITKPSYAGYHHPTHMNGINFPVPSPFYSGTTSIPFHTEFPITVTGAYQKQELVGFDIREFYELREDGTNSLPAVKPFPAVEDSVIGTNIMDLTYIKPLGTKENHAKSNYFRFAIAIDNPDASSDMPVIFGAFSGVIQSMPFKNKVELDGKRTSIVIQFKLLQETSIIKRTIV